MLDVFAPGGDKKQNRNKQTTTKRSHFRTSYLVLPNLYTDVNEDDEKGRWRDEEPFGWLAGKCQ